MLIATVAGIVGLWIFGRGQPIEPVSVTTAQTCASCSGRGIVDCPECGGYGSSRNEEACAACEGTGKGTWQLAPSDRKFKKSRLPVCTKCKGTGVAGGSRKNPCNHCKSTGKVPCVACAGSGMGVGVGRVISVKAGLSPWEKFLSWCSIEPDFDAAPARTMNGSYPLLTAFLDQKAPIDVDYMVLDWGKPEWTGSQWETLANIQIRKVDKITTNTVRFVVANRSVLSGKPVNSVSNSHD
jgi:hypothetical protein